MKNIKPEINESHNEKASIQLGHLQGYFWRLLLGGCLILVFCSFLAFFLEGKSSYDLGFTLWDDRFAKVTFGNMGDVIMPQTLFYGIFFLITAISMVFIIKRKSIKTVVAGTLILTSFLLILYLAFYGIIQLTYLGSRQGPAGWLILEFPWLSLVLFCLTLFLGLIALWLLFYPEIISSDYLSKITSKSKKWLIWSGLGCIRCLIIIGMFLGAFSLNAGLILFLNNINIVLILGVSGCIASLSIVFFKRDIFTPNIKEREQLKSIPKAEIEGRKLHIFKRNDLKTNSRGGIEGNFAFIINPRNSVWRTMRKLIIGLFTIICLGLMVAMCFMTIPDEWIFIRFFDLLPWALLGILIAVGVMNILPEPAIYFPITLAQILMTYDAFLKDYSTPFNAEFIIINGLFLGFWIGVLFISQEHMYRTKGKGRNLYFFMVMMLVFFVSFLMVTLVDRFQHDGDMIQRVITDVLHVLIPILIDISIIFLGVTAILWIIDILYRFYRRKNPLKLISKPISPKKIEKSPKISLHEKFTRIQIKISEKNRKILALACIGVLMFSFIFVQFFIVENSHIRPLLLRNEEFGVWTVSGVTKVEKHYPIQMPENAPTMSEIEVSAARGEWEGWHVIISPQPGKSVKLTKLEWDNFTHTTSSAEINSNITEVFLVEYLVDEQPDQLLELSSEIIKYAGEHIDLFCRLKVPRDATSGIYSSQITLTVNSQEYQIKISLKVFDFTMPIDRHIRNAFGGGWQTEQWYDELEYLRISQYDMGIPFREGEQYWWNETLQKFEFNWTVYDLAFEAQLNRSFTGIRQGYFPKRPSNITDDSIWALVENWFLNNVSTHLKSKTWLDELGTNHSWVEIPYNYWTDEPDTSEYEHIKEVNDRYHADSSNLRTLLTEEFLEEFPILHDVVDIWCPVIGNFEPSAVENRHAAGQEYWFYVCVAPTAPYPNMMLWEIGHDPRLLPLIAARFNVDGFLYWRMTAGNDTYRAGFEGNGDGQVAFEDPNTGRPLPSLRLLSFSAGVEDFEYIWLMRKTLENQTKTGPIPSELLSRAANIELKLSELVGVRPQFVNHDLSLLNNLREGLASLLEDLWPYTQKLY